MKHTSRRKNARRKYKRIVAALAGAAVVSSALLPGFPLSKVQAAENTAITAPSPGTEASPPAEDRHDASKDTRETATENAANRDRDKERPDKQQSASPIAAVKAAAAAYGFDARRDNFSLQSQGSTNAVVIVHTDNGRTFKVRLTKSDATWKIDSVTKVVTGGYGDSTIHLSDPVEVVKEHAAIFGFNAYDDSFALLSMAGDKAIVQVRTSGQTFKVDLEKSGNSWVITTIRGIGNSKYPATYRPASFYGYADTIPAVTVTERTVYNNGSFADWAWHEDAYPTDMKVGVLFFKPESADTSVIPDSIVDKIKSIDFSRQLVLYTHIGSVPSQGYGIGIEKVVQVGNDLTVTIRTKSPLDNHQQSSTVTNDVIPLDRLTLNFDKPVHIRFIDQNGTTLSNYTLDKR